MNQVFISYSRSDKEWLARLLKHLKPVLRREPTAIWWDGQIMVGQRWRTEIDKALESANVGVLLISANFLHSDFIAHNELPYLLGKAKECGIKLLAVLLSNCLYDEVGLAEIQFINSTSKPLDRCRGGNLNEALVSICKAIRNEIDAGKLKQDPEVTLKKEDVSLDKLPANPALGEPRLVGRIKGLVTSPKFVPDQGQSSNLPADMPYTMVIAFLEISNVGMPSIANDFRMVVIFKNGARIATKLNMMDSAKLRFEDSKLFEIPSSRFLYNLAAQRPIPTGGARLDALSFMIDSFNRESIALPGNRAVVYFKDVVGKEYSCDYPFTGKVQWNVIIPGWKSME